MGNGVSLVYPVVLALIGAAQSFQMPDAPLQRYEPQYPLAALENGDVAMCRVDLLRREDGTVTATGVRCAATGSDFAFERASARTVERWQYAPSDQNHALQTCFTFRLYGIEIPDHFADICEPYPVS